MTKTNNTLGQKYAKILGIHLTSTSKEALLRKIEVDIKQKKKFIIVTPNPEHVMLAQEDLDFRHVLNHSEVAVADGVGLIAANKFLNLKAPKSIFVRFPVLVLQGIVVGVAVVVARRWLEESLVTIKGRELFLDIIDIANKKYWKVYFLGGEDTEALNAKKELEKNYKRIKIKTNSGPMLNAAGMPITSTDKAKEKEVMDDINSFAPDFLFVGISHPRQEKWLYRWYQKLNIKGSMVVGGTFRYVSGVYKNPPKMVSSLGLEWLWRLVTGSQKFSRVWTAVVRFPYEIFRVKLFAKNENQQ